MKHLLHQSECDICGMKDKTGAAGTVMGMFLCLRKINKENLVCTLSAIHSVFCHFRNEAPTLNSLVEVVQSASLPELSSDIISLTCGLTAKPQFCLP